MITGTCINCNPFERAQGEGYTCGHDVCPDEINYIIVREGTCELCPDGHPATEDRRFCTEPVVIDQVSCTEF